MGMVEHISEAKARMVLVDDRNGSDPDPEPEHDGHDANANTESGNEDPNYNPAARSDSGSNGFNYFGPQYESSGEDDNAIEEPWIHAIRACSPRPARIVAGRQMCGRQRCCWEKAIERSNTLHIVYDGELRISAAKVQDVHPKDLLFNGNLSRHQSDQPIQDWKLQHCVEAYVQVQGNLAHALLDSGSNVDIISTDFAEAMGLKVFELKDPLSLQMARVGSKAKLQYGVFLDLKGPLIDERCYFDVANVEGFDMILGTPFLYSNGITLHFNNDCRTYV